MKYRDGSIVSIFPLRCPSPSMLRARERRTPPPAKMPVDHPPGASMYVRDSSVVAPSSQGIDNPANTYPFVPRLCACTSVTENTSNAATIHLIRSASMKSSSYLYRRAPLVAAVIVATLLPCVAAAQKHPITHEDVYTARRLGAPVVSPDGKWMVLQVTEPAYHEKDQNSDLW